MYFFPLHLSLSSDEMNILKWDSGSETTESDFVGYQLTVGEANKMGSLGLTYQNKCRGIFTFFFFFTVDYFSIKIKSCQFYSSGSFLVSEAAITKSS